jgi:hypothetical protein
MNLAPIKGIIALALAAAILVSCNNKPATTESKEQSLPIVGTWQLISGTTIQKKDTVITDYTKGKKGIKIINATHFSFLNHDLDKGKSATPFFDVGGGRYTLVGDKYTEYLEYCNDRQWENNKFEFTVTITGDTLLQKGIEKIDSIGINRINIEKYIRVKSM